MKPKSFFPVVLFAIAAAAPIPAVAQTTGPGPYYAWPAWDQKLQCDTQATCPRFIVLSNWNNQAVLDRETGLVWERSPSTSTFTWSNAQLHCNLLTVANRIGWRLPTLQELASLVDRGQSFPALPTGHPFSNVQSSFYWSAATFAIVASFAWGVFFDSGNVSFDDKSVTFFVWCVRGGQGVDPQ
jgi:hypothetical protein